MVAEVVAVASRSAGFATGRAAAAGSFRVFVQDETFYVSLPRTGMVMMILSSIHRGIESIPLKLVESLGLGLEHSSRFLC